MKTSCLALTVAGFILAAHAALGQKLPDCGFQGGRTCHPFDTEFWYAGACDRGLKIDTRNFFDAEDDKCVNDVRNALSKDYSWVGWSLSQQRYNIGADEPINWITHLSAHNAYNNFADGYQIPNQEYTITSLLNLGVRSMELDLWWENKQLRLCHGGKCVAFDRAYAYSIKEIAQWLADNPGEVLVIVFENNAEDHDEWVTAPIQDYLGSIVWKQSDSTAAQIKDRFPTMNEIRRAGKQILFLSDGLTSDLIFPLDDNPFPSSKAMNLAPASCIASYTDGDGNSVRYDLTAKNNRWIEVYEARSEFDVFAPAGTLNETDVSQLTRCGVSTIGLDFIHALNAAPLAYMRLNPPDGRREATVWSWAPNDMGANGNLALFRGSDGRWISKDASKPEQYPFACYLPRTGDPNTWRDKRGHNWWITTTKGTWHEGPGHCRNLGLSIGVPDLAFGAPPNGYSNAKLQAKVGSGGHVWIKESVRPIPNPTATPHTLEILASEGIGAEIPTKVFKIWGTPDAQLTFTHGTSTGGNWFTIAPSSNYLSIHGTPVTVTVNQNVVKTLKRGTYQGWIKVTPVNNTSLSEFTMHVFLRVKVPTTVTLTANKPLTNPIEEVTFKANLKYVQTSEFRATGQIELREVVTDAAGGKSIVKLGTAIVNSTADGVSEPDNQVSFKITALQPGLHRLAAFYLGDNEYGASLSPELQHQVRIAPQVALIASPARISAPGHGITLTVKAASTVPGQPVTGRINFMDGSTFLGQRTLVNGEASWAIANPTAGSHLFMAAYLPDGGFDGTSSNVLKHWVGAPTPVVIQTSPAGLPVLIDGVQHATPYSANWVMGDTHTLNSVETVAREYRRNFLRWSDGATESRQIDVREAPISLTMHYEEQYPIYVTTVGSGYVVRDPPGDSSWYARGTTVKLEAKSTYPMLFKNWSGDITGSTNPRSFQIAGVTRITANFVFPIDVTIASAPLDRSYKVDGVDGYGQRYFRWVPGTQHTLSAMPSEILSPGYRVAWDSWLLNGTVNPEREVTITVPETSPASYYARYRHQSQLTTTAGAGGSIQVEPPSADGWYGNGVAVRITAVPRAGYRFTGFSGALTGTTNPQSLSMLVPRNVVANFEPDPSASALPPTVVASVAGKTGTSDARIWTVQLEHTSGGPVTAASISSVTITLAGGGTCSSPPRLLSALPANFGALVGGKSTVPLTFNFSGCSAAARFTVDAQLSVNGTVVTQKWSSQFR